MEELILKVHINIKGAYTARLTLRGQRHLRGQRPLRGQRQLRGEQQFNHQKSVIY